MPRFVPAAAVQGGQLPTQQDQGIDVGGALGAARTGANTLAAGARFLDMDALGGGLGAAGGAFGLGTGAMKLSEGNTVGGVSDLASGATGAIRGLDQLGLISMTPAVAGGLGVAGGALGMGLGANQLAQGDMSGIASLYSGALAGTAGLGTVAGTGALGGSMAAAAPAMTAALNPLTAALGVFLALGLMNLEHQKAARIKNQTIESGKIRQGGKQGLDTLDKTARFLPGLDQLPTDQLPGLLEQYREGLAQHPAVQQLLATRGQGGKVSKSDPVPDPTLDAITAQYYPALRDTQAGYLWAQDAAARSGQPMPEWMQSFGQSDPATLLRNMGRGVGGDQDTGIDAATADYSQAVPGNMVVWMQQQLGGSDPALTSLLGTLPALPGQAPTAEAMAQQSQARQQQALAQNGGNSQMQGQNINALAYTAPYTPGGLQASMTQALGASQGEQAMIADLLARGGDPVGIRNAVLAQREAAGGGSYGG